MIKKITPIVIINLITSILIFSMAINLFSLTVTADSGTNHLKWTYSVDSNVVDIIVSGNGLTTVFGTSNNTIYSIDSEGDFMWNYHFTNSDSSPDYYRLTGVAISDNGNTIAAITRSSEARAFGDNGGLLWTDSQVEYDETISISDDGALISFGIQYGGNWNRHLVLYNREGTKLWENGEHSVITLVEMSGDGHTIITGEYFGTDYYLTSSNRQGSLLWTKSDYSEPIHSISVSDDGNTIAIGCDDDRVYVYDSDGNQLWSYSTIDGNEVYVSVSDDGSTIAIGSNDQKVVVFSRNGTKLFEYMTTNFVHSVSVSNDGTIIAAGATDGRIYAFDRSGVLLWEYKTGGDIKVSLSNDGEILVAGSNDRNIYCFLTSEVVDTVKPTVTITSPSSGDTSASTTVTISGTASDNVGISKVQISKDGINWIDATGTTSWSGTLTLNKGSNTIYAKATDTSGNTQTTSITVSVVLNLAPTCTINSPTSEQTVSGIATISGTASDPDGDTQLVKVEVRVDSGLWLTTTGTTSWSYSWDTTTVSDGQHTIYVRAYDGTNYSTVKSVTVTVNQAYVNQAPTVTISSPTSGETVKSTVIVSGGASDPDGVVSIVQVRVDSGSWETVSGTISWSYSWDTTKVSDGSHTVSVRSFDGKDYSSIDSVSVNVKNKKEEGGKGFIPGFEAITLIAVIGICVILLRKKDWMMKKTGRRKKDILQV